METLLLDLLTQWWDGRCLF